MVRAVMVAASRAGVAPRPADLAQSGAADAPPAEEAVLAAALTLPADELPPVAEKPAFAPLAKDERTPSVALAAAPEAAFLAP